MHINFINIYIKTLVSRVHKCHPKIDHPKIDPFHFSALYEGTDNFNRKHPDDGDQGNRDLDPDITRSTYHSYHGLNRAFPKLHNGIKRTPDSV